MLNVLVGHDMILHGEGKHAREHHLQKNFWSTPKELLVCWIWHSCISPHAPLILTYVLHLPVAIENLAATTRFSPFTGKWFTDFLFIHVFFVCNRNARFVHSHVRLIITGDCFTPSLHSREYIVQSREQWPPSCETCARSGVLQRNRRSFIGKRTSTQSFSDRNSKLVCVAESYSFKVILYLRNLQEKLNRTFLGNYAWNP